MAPAPPRTIADNGAWLLSGLALVCAVFVGVKFIKHRRFYIGLPTPPHSLLWGNLKVMGEGVKNYPSDFHPQPLFTELATKYDLRGLYYLDIYPFGEPIVFITDPGVAMQTQTSPNFFRHPFALSFLGGLVGKKSIFSTNGAEWQQQRSWFAPAFSMAHILTLVPGMIEETLVFKEKLARFAVSGEVFSMNDATVRLTIDLIGRNVGDIRLKSQTEYSPIQEAFSGAVDWTAGHTDPTWKKILSPVMMGWYTRKLDKLLGAVIKEKYRNKTSEDSGDKSILDLALRGYSKDHGKLGRGKMTRPDLDEEFMAIALDNAKVFFAGGHDTTASLLTYTYYYLSINPTILSRVRAEHDQIFGTGLETTIDVLTATPALINQLPLTLAVLKEVLRLHPLGFTIRKAAPGATVTFEGRTYPVENHMIAVLFSAMHRSPTWWTNPTEFDPDRFLTPETHSTAAWQPFEKGPRNCIGQQLALLEAKVVCLLTLRYLDFEAVFKEHGLSIPGWGGQAYQELKLSAKPKDGIPMRARLR